MRTGNEKKQQADKQAYIILTVVAAIVIAIIAYNMYQAGESGRYDDRMCRTDRPLAGMTAILIDKSDPISDAEVAALQKRIRQISDKLQRNELLTFYVLNGDNANNLAEGFCLCNPGQGASANALTQNPAFIQQKYDSSFGAPLAKALSVLKSGQGTETSPLIEAVRALSEIEEFQKAPKHRSIVLISDMLQHTREYSQYSNGITYADFSKSEYGQKMLPDLKGVAVAIEYISQKKYKKSQTPEHQQFWKEYFKAAGASTVSLHVVGESGLTGISLPSGGEDLPPVPVKPLHGYRTDAVAPASGGIQTVSGANQAEGGDFTANDMRVPTEGIALASHETVPVAAKDFAVTPITQPASEPDPDVTSAAPMPEPAPAASPTRSGVGAPPTTGSESVTPEPSLPVDEAPRESVPHIEEAPTVRKQVPASYPDLARSAGVQGTVMVNALIGPDGIVKEVKVLKSIPMLDNAALEAVRRWHFKPGMVNKKPIHVWVAVPVTFRLKS